MFNRRTLTCALATLLTWAVPIALASEPLKPRIIVLTDISPISIEPDDTESMVRLLVYADMFEIEGLVATTGWSNGGDNPAWVSLIRDEIAAYEKDLPNLRQRSGQKGHRPDETRQEIGYWPSPDYLRSKTVVGSQKRGMQFIGKENDSAGSELIIRAVDEKDERPVWVLGWGGGNTLAQAIWRVKQDRSESELKAFLQKIRFYAITDQDRGYERGTPFDISSHQWMRREFEGSLLFLWDESAWMYQNGTGRAKWNEYAAEIQGQGFLGALYPKFRYGVEGDTPSFLYLLPNGLNDPEYPSHGGWGGFFGFGIGPDQATKAYVNQQGTMAQPISRKYEERFYAATFRDFVARMNWAKNGRGNRNPVVSINGERGIEILKLTPAAGVSVTLDASQSSDPDGDRLHFSWWVLPEAGTYAGAIGISRENANRARYRSHLTQRAKVFTSSVK